MHPSNYPREYEMVIPDEAADVVTETLGQHSDSAKWRGAATDGATVFPSDGGFTLTVKYDSQNTLPPAPTVKPFMMAKFVAPALKEHSTDAGVADGLLEFAQALREHGDPQSPSPNDAAMPFYLYVDSPPQ